MTGIINKSALEEIRTIYPPLSLQRKFGMLATEMRELKVQQAASRRNMDALFQSLLHRAFQGEL
jgi:restriction endonuclease S subunit